MGAGLAGSHQYQNANLAVHLAKKFLQAKGVMDPETGLPESFVDVFDIQGGQAAVKPYQTPSSPPSLGSWMAHTRQRV